MKAYKKMILRKETAREDETAADISLFSGKRQAVVENIIKDIAIRIIQAKRTEFSSASEPIREVSEPSGDFVYNTLTAQGEKVTRTLACEAADFLLKSIERLAREEAVDSEI